MKPETFRQRAAVRAGMVCAALLLCGLFAPAGSAQGIPPLRIAVEFNAHAAGAYVALDRGLYAAEGLSVEAYESYATGVALSAALTRGHIQAAYMCLIPAINAYRNGGVPIRVVAGTHLYGYGLVVNPERIGGVQDLEKAGIRIGCMQPGSAVDALLHKAMEKRRLSPEKVLAQTRRMSPEKTILAIQARQLDAAFLPEHWATLAERHGFSMLLTARDLWPDMIGSVLVVKEDLLGKQPRAVRGLIRATKNATNWIHAHPADSARIVARYLSIEGEGDVSDAARGKKERPGVTPEMVRRAMERLEYTVSLDGKMVQETIDHAARLGNIKKRFAADALLALPSDP